MINVRVPATSANMGPGFDCLGVALQLYNYVSVEETDSGLQIEIRQADFCRGTKETLYIAVCVRFLTCAATDRAGFI